LVDHIAALVDRSDGGVGAKGSDVNLDGLINAIDLAIMRQYFGTALDVGWRYGNANCDDVVNATDLAILKANFGFEVPMAAAVPETATRGLLALGGAALRRRGKK
jgi:hypothetical protein